MLRYSILGMFLLLAQIAHGETWDQIRKQLETATTTTGPLYATARSDLVNLGSNAVPQLAEISANTNEPWQTRLMAGIVAERIQQGAEVTALIDKDWKKDPEYDMHWDKDRCGALPSMAPLAVRRYREAGLWYYYVEVIWKETGEHSQAFRKWEPDWRGISAKSCANSPVYDLLVEVLEERIRNDIGFKEHERWGEFEFLLNSKTNTPLPFLLEIVPQVPGNESQREDMMFKALKNMAQPGDVPLIEKHFRDKAQDVPEMLREPLRQLKDRQNRKSTSP